VRSAASTAPIFALFQTRPQSSLTPRLFGSLKVRPHCSCSCDSLFSRVMCEGYDKSRDKQYAPHELLVREAPLAVGTSKVFSTSRPSHVDDDEH
jgi:hypothetical protein